MAELKIKTSAYYKEVTRGKGKEKTWQPQSVKVKVSINHLTERRNHHV